MRGQTTKTQKTQPKSGYFGIYFREYGHRASLSGPWWQNSGYRLQFRQEAGIVADSVPGKMNMLKTVNKARALVEALSVALEMTA